jgi:hypothetical protein
MSGKITWEDRTGLYPDEKGKRSCVITTPLLVGGMQVPLNRQSLKQQVMPLGEVWNSVCAEPMLKWSPS